MRKLAIATTIFFTALLATPAQSYVLEVDQALADKIVDICKFVQGKGHPEALRVKGMAWCKVGSDYIPDEFPEQQTMVNSLFQSEDYKSLLANDKFEKEWKKAKRRFAEISLGM